MNIEQIRKDTRAAGNFSDKDLEFLSEEFVRASQETAQEVKPGVKGEHATPKPGAHIWQGNHFYVSGLIWHWQSTPGSQCGTTQNWQYHVQPGDTVRNAGTCPQGYPWVEMQLNYP
jgi:hypothetical protein